MKIIIAGGRDFNDYELMKSKLDSIIVPGKTVTIISGMASGADALGVRYAKEKGYRLLPFPADWKMHGKAAGPIRNGAMAKNANTCVVFWNGKSPGTANMILNAKRHNLNLTVVKY